jgi:hypothetical protein
MQQSYFKVPTQKPIVIEVSGEPLGVVVPENDGYKFLAVNFPVFGIDGHRFETVEAAQLAARAILDDAEGDEAIYVCVWSRFRTGKVASTFPGNAPVQSFTFSIPQRLGRRRRVLNSQCQLRPRLRARSCRRVKPRRRNEMLVGFVSLGTAPSQKPVLVSAITGTQKVSLTPAMAIRQDILVPLAAVRTPLGCR